MVSAAWGISSLPACAPPGPKPGDRVAGGSGEQSPRGSPLGSQQALLAAAFRSHIHVPWHPLGWADSAIVVTSSRQTPMRVVLFCPAASWAGPGASTEARQGGGWSPLVSGRKWAGLCRLEDLVCFLQARVARLQAGRLKPQTRGD